MVEPDKPVSPVAGASIDETLIPLGKLTVYPQSYDPSVLFAVARQTKRSELGIGQTLPFSGEDLWTAYEISWLNDNGRPQVAIGEFSFPCESEYIVESKSFKLYLNSLNQTKLPSRAELQSRLTIDLAKVCGQSVKVKLYTFAEYREKGLSEFSGECLDDLDVVCSEYNYSPELLAKAAGARDEDVRGEGIRVGQSRAVYSHLFKSNCLITGQPDWASLFIEYQGISINNDQLLQYLVSFRNHNEFHEQCVERIFSDIMHHCQPAKLLVYARFARRGGLDINPWRSTEAGDKNRKFVRISRQ